MTLHPFWFHFSKQMTEDRGKVQWKVHFREFEYVVDGIVCHRPTESGNRDTQPIAVVKGLCNEVTIKNGVAEIT